LQFRDSRALLFSIQASFYFALPGRIFTIDFPCLGALLISFGSRRHESPRASVRGLSLLLIVASHRFYTPTNFRLPLSCKPLCYPRPAMATLEWILHLTWLLLVSGQVQVVPHHLYSGECWIRLSDLARGKASFWEREKDFSLLSSLLSHEFLASVFYHTAKKTSCHLGGGRVR